MHIALAAAGILLLAAILAQASAIAVERRSLRTRPPGPDGVIPGAQAVRLAGGSRAVLLLHGGGDTPQSLGYLAAHLNGAGYTVAAPLLPGHGTTLRAFGRATADQWLSAVRESYDALRRDHDWVAIVAQSMGGALAAQVAAAHPELPALVLISPYLSMPPRLALAALAAPALALFMPYPRSADQRSIRDAGERARSLGFGIFPTRTLAELRRTALGGWTALPRVRAPTLVIQSREDNRIASAAAQRAFDRLGSREKRLEWIEGAGHVLTVDYGREHVFSLATEWLETHGGATSASRPASSLRDRPDSLPPL